METKKYLIYLLKLPEKAEWFEVNDVGWSTIKEKFGHFINLETFFHLHIFKIRFLTKRQLDAVRDEGQVEYRESVRNKGTLRPCSYLVRMRDAS